LVALRNRRGKAGKFNAEFLATTTSSAPLGGDSSSAEEGASTSTKSDVEEITAISETYKKQKEFKARRSLVNTNKKQTTKDILMAIPYYKDFENVSSC
jgi:hypothetical protein